MRVGSGTRLPTALSSLRSPPLGLKASPRMRVGMGPACCWLPADCVTSPPGTTKEQLWITAEATVRAGPSCGQRRRRLGSRPGSRRGVCTHFVHHAAGARDPTRAACPASAKQLPARSLGTTCGPRHPQPIQFLENMKKYKKRRQHDRPTANRLTANR